jgi:hypothetical protein
MAALEMQKADAKRWLQRQQVRLMCQCDEVAKEKIAIFSMLDDEMVDLDEFLQQFRKN